MVKEISTRYFSADHKRALDAVNKAQDFAVDTGPSEIKPLPPELQEVLDDVEENPDENPDEDLANDWNEFEI